ncbi:hypothetical protein MQA28_25810, partial [Escherichia coli]|nr:hypothetical protein [Escherichia coli]
MLVLSTLLCALLALSEPNSLPEHQKRAADCYEGLGCFSNDAPFFSLQRPISFVPQSPETINPKFNLYTRRSPTTAHRLYANNLPVLSDSTFDASKPTKFVVHGFIDNGIIADWMREMKDEFLRQGDYNVILVDWGEGSLALYGQATANTRVVGAMIAQLITFLQNATGAQPENMHVIGHSLGSHVAGYAGERLRHLGRITGLDPAEPYFQNTDRVVRLDPTDALFVDVIHTDAASFYSLDFGLGMSQTCGHVDYFPNAGYDMPGCQNDGAVMHIATEGLVQGTREFAACNHMRAVHFFTESINSVCPFEGYRCASEEDFNAGKCLPCSGQACGWMGLHADRVQPPRGTNQVKYFLKTGDGAPFCRYHFKVDVTFANPHGSQQERGQLMVHLTGVSGETEQVLVNEEMDNFDPGSTYSFILTSQMPLGDIRNISFRWHQDARVLDIGSWDILGLRHPQLYIQRITVVSGEEQHTTSFCGQGIAVETDTTQIFT